MKTIIAILLTVSGAMANAECCRPVSRPKAKCATKTVVVEKVKYQPFEVTRIVVKRMYKKNRLSLVGGTGPTRIVVGQTQIGLERGLVGGVQYQRMLNDTVSVGVQVQTNETVMGSVGLDF